MDVRCPGEGAQQQVVVAVVVNPVPAQVLRFDVVCRMCGNEDENNVDIFSDEGVKHELALKMNTYLPVKVADGDSLPSNCCWNCVSLIVSWHELVALSVETDRKLKELLVVDAELRAVSPKVEIEPAVVVCHMDTAVVKEEDAGFVDFRDAITKREDEDSIGSTSSVNTKAEVSKSNEEPICDVCGKLFSSNSNLFCHKRELHKEDASQPNAKVTCNICNKSFAERKKLTQHKKNFHQNEKERTYICELCREEFSEKIEYFSHVREVHSEITKPIGPAPDENLTKFSCNICDCSYVRNGNLIRHKKTKHSKCSEGLPLKRVNLAKYKVIVDDKVLYECHICKKRYDKPFSFSLHRRIHIKGCSDECDVCGKRYTRQSSLWRHRNENHTAERFTCKICGAQFRSKIVLAQHTNIHTDNRPYVCDVCGKAYRQKSTLSMHKWCHSAGVQFGCDLCGKRFRLRVRLQQHMRKHHPEETCSCDVCGDTFSQPSYLDEHKRSACVNNVDERV